MEKTKQRIGWIDVTKGIAILLVILGHSLVGLKINDYIFAFHMPVFFITSGILFRPKSIPAVIKKNAQKLLIPYGITAVFVIIGRAASAYIQHWTPEIIKSLCINTAIGSLFGFGVDEVRWFFPVWRIGAIWFLLAFFWSTLFMHCPTFSVNTCGYRQMQISAVLLFCLFMPDIFFQKYRFGKRKNCLLSAGCS